jgi:Zn-dependent peptidase ImmA (M78 family)
MEWVEDRSRSFVTRPHYSFEELESQCEVLVNDFLVVHRGQIRFPFTTDDMTVLIETMVQSLDLYADFSQEQDPAIEGVTTFFANALPTIRIRQELSTNPRSANRLRTTLSHELGHVIFHQVMFRGPSTPSLFGTDRVNERKCQRGTMLQASHTDWMEWQAGFASGAFLMPRSALADVVRSVAKDMRLPAGKLSADSPEGKKMIRAIADTFLVSSDAARVRLSQREVVVAGPVSRALFS